MCGIAGWVSTARAVPRPEFEAMTDRLRHRGPDGRGARYFRDGRVALGHRRLAIQDLSPAGAQPMELSAAGLTLTFNGEIYNHPELRRELESSGAVYRTECDAESILHAYARWGPDAVSRLRGIFAFAIWDEGKGELFAARDHLGVKPFYLAELGPDIAFASQISAFLSLSAFAGEVSPGGMADALRYGVVAGDRAIYEGVSKLPPAHCLHWRDGRFRTWRYWSLPEDVTIRDVQTAREEVSALLTDCIGSQMLSDVPVHTLLSGGIDSSTVTAIAMRSPDKVGKAFTLGFDNPAFDETAFARRAAEAVGCEHETRMLSAVDAERVLDRATEAFDEPFGIDSALPMIAISELMANEGVKVTLSGDGADEMFAGYRHYDALAAHYRRHGRRTAEGHPATFLARLRDRLSGGFSPFPTYTSHNGWIHENDLPRLSGPRLRDVATDGFRREREVFPRDCTPVDAARRADLQSYLPDEILVKVDRATMAYGIEARVPFLDHRLVELAFRIDPELHYAGGERKALLKNAARQWLPESLLTSRKKGFSAPVTDFFLARPEAEAKALAEVETGPLVAEGWLDRKAIARAVRRSEYTAGATLQLILLDKWYRRWVTGRGTA